MNLVADASTVCFLLIYSYTESSELGRTGQVGEEQRMDLC